jgi:hypothetical protein
MKITIYYDNFSKNIVNVFRHRIVETNVISQHVEFEFKKLKSLDNSKGNRIERMLLSVAHKIETSIRKIRIPIDTDWISVFESIDFDLIASSTNIQNVVITFGDYFQPIKKMLNSDLFFNISNSDVNKPLALRSGYSAITREPSTHVKITLQDFCMNEISEVSAAYPTHKYMSDNLYFIQAAGFLICLDILKEYVQKNFNNDACKQESVTPVSFDSSKITYIKVIKYFLRLSLGIAKNRSRSFIREVPSPEWYVGVINSSWRNLESSNIHILPNPPGHALADPFVVTWAGITGIFDYEITKCIVEDFHLSFPFTFEFEGALYMCPESAESKSIRIYKCIDFPNVWEFKNEIFSDVVAVDSVFFLKDNAWWMISGMSNLGHLGRMSELRCFSSSNPIEGNWLKHFPLTVLRDSNCGRNGGFLIEKDSIIRVRQKYGYQKYGSGISLAKLQSISPNSFDEKCLLDLDLQEGSSIDGLHHLSGNENITAIDLRGVSLGGVVASISELGIKSTYWDVPDNL